MLTWYELLEYGWFVKMPRKTRKIRLQKKWVNQYEAQRQELFGCDHDWRKRRNPPEGERTFDLVCSKCRCISYTANEE